MPNASLFVVPFKKPKLIGRDADLRPLHELVNNNEDSAVPVITGQPGVGKTQLAALYIHTYRAGFPGGIFWLDLAHFEEGNILRQISGSFAPALGLSSDLSDARERDRHLSEQWLGRIRNNPDVLIIADAVPQPNALQQLPGLPNSSLLTVDCKLIATSRLRGIPGCVDYHLGVLPRDRGRELLLSEAGRSNGGINADEEEAINEVYGILGGLPLTLRLCSGLVREEHLTFRDIANALAETGVMTIIDETESTLEDYQVNVSRALHYFINDTFGKRPGEGADLLHTLKVISCFPDGAILRLDFLRHFIQLKPSRIKAGNRFNSVIRDLHRRSLVDYPGNAKGCVRIHNLIHEYARKLIEPFFFEDVIKAGTDSILSPENLLARPESTFLYLARDISLITGAAAGHLRPETGEELASLRRVIERQAFPLRSNDDAIQQIFHQAMVDRAKYLADKLDAALSARKLPWLKTVWSTSRTDPSLVRTFRGHRDWVRSCSFDHKGHRALSTSSDRTLVLWDVATGEAVMFLTGHSAAVFSHTFCGPGDNALSASLDRKVIFWDLTTGHAQKIFENHRCAVIHCSTTPCGERGLSASVDRQLITWDLASGRKTHELEAPDDWSSSCVLHPNGHQVLIGLKTGECIVVDVSASAQSARVSKNHSAAITGISINERGDRVLTTTADGVLSFWDLETAATLRELRLDDQRILSSALDAEGKLALTSTADGCMTLWDLEAGKRIRTDRGHHGPILSCNLSRDGSKALSGSTDGVLMLWDITERHETGSRTGHSGAVWCCKLSPNGDIAVSGGNDGTAHVWDTRSGEILTTLIAGGGPIHDCAISANGEIVVTAGADGFLRQWNVRSGALVNEVRGHWGPVRTIDISADGSLVVSAGSDHKTVSWSPAKNTLHTIVGKQSSLVRSCALSRDPSILALGLSDGLILLWDVLAGKPFRTLRGHTADVLCCTFCDDTSILVSASADGSIRRWHLGGESASRIVASVGDGLRACCFDANGDVALTAREFRTITLWDLTTPRCLSSLSLDALTSVAYAANGCSVIVGDGKGDLSFLRIEA